MEKETKKVHKEMTVKLPLGFHMRPITQLVNHFKKDKEHKIRVSKSGGKGKSVNGHSAMELLTLGIKQGDRILVEVQGYHAADVLEAWEKHLVELTQKEKAELAQSHKE